MRAALYCRLSREDEDCGRTGRESESIQNQRAMLLAYAAARGYAVYGVYVDEDYSGADSLRPAFNALLADAEKGKFELVLAKSQSRFTRDMELVERYLHGKFPEWGVRFLSVVDGADTDDAANKKMRQINGLVNEWYLEDLSENVRSVLTHKRQAGQYIAGSALYGYQKDPLDKNHLVIDATSAAVVRRIFSLCLEGLGAARIAALLNAEGVPSPTRYKQGAGMADGTGKWSRATIYGMLRNETYAGNLVQGRHRRVSYKSKKIITLPREQWIVVRGTHAPVVEPAQFARVQALLARRATHPDRTAASELPADFPTPPP